MGVAYVHFGVEGYLYDRAALVVVRFLFVEDECNGPFDNDEVDIRVAVVDGDRIAFFQGDVVDHDLVILYELFDDLLLGYGEGNDFF